MAALSTGASLLRVDFRTGDPTRWRTDFTGAALGNTRADCLYESVEVEVPGLAGRFPAAVLGSDPETDLAFLKIEAGQPLATAPVGTSADLRQGQWCSPSGIPRVSMVRSALASSRFAQRKF